MHNNKSTPFRVAIFASYDKEQIIHDYVVTYVQRLKEVCDKVIFIADNDAPKTEQNKLKGLADFMQFKRHGEYDFGSYKIGWNTLKEQPWFDDVDEVILCNDSCFTIGSFKPVFAEMDAHKCDFWGMTESNIHRRHLQSFFLVFKRKVFTSPVLDNFMTSITKQNSFEDIVQNYEIPIESMLEKNGFVSDAFIKGLRAPHQRPLTTMKMHMPLIKRKNFPAKMFSLDGTSLEGMGIVLYKIRQSSPKDYEEIMHYFKKNPIVLIVAHFLKIQFNKMLRFFYQKKVTSRGSLIIKICKIPVFHIKKQTIEYYKYLFEKKKLTFLCLIHKISKPDYKMKKQYIKEKMLSCRCTLGVAYNVFDGEELLEASIKSIRPVASYIVVVWQKISNFGEKANPNLESFLTRLKEDDLIDELYLYEPKFNQSDKNYNEKAKRNIGLQLVKKAGCDYFLSMDTDEFYHADQVQNALKYISENKISSSAVSIIEYLKEPTYQIVNGYTFSPAEHKNDYTFYVPFIMKIHHFKKQKHSSKGFPCIVDPTRGLNTNEKFYLFSKHLVAMHHFSTTRTDLAKKYKNSNLRKNEKNNELEILEKQILAYKYEDNLVQLSSFNGLYIKKVPNVFGIDWESSK